MNYLYHIVPKNMKGSTLYPLNQLKKKYPKIYNSEIKKYIRRKNILKKKLHYLNCYWTDVLFFTAVHPLKIKKALKKAGIIRKEKRKYLKIDPRSLNKKDAVIYLYKYDTMKKEGTIDNFIKFDPKKLSKYNKVPNKTIKYYKEKNKIGQRPLLFHFIPHIIYKSSLPIRKAKIIEI